MSKDERHNASKINILQTFTALRSKQQTVTATKRLRIANNFFSVWIV